jgi:hypothetical protein
VVPHLRHVCYYLLLNASDDGGRRWTRFRVMLLLARSFHGWEGDDEMVSACLSFSRLADAFSDACAFGGDS